MELLLNDLYKFFETENWLPVRVTGTAPGARSAPATVVHESQSMMYVFGGYDGGRSLNDLFRFDLSTSEWAQVTSRAVPRSQRPSSLGWLCWLCSSRALLAHGIAPFAAHSPDR